VKEPAPSRPLFEPELSDNAEVGTLQPANGAAEPDWEGFNGGDGESTGEEDDSSGEESVEIVTKKKEKPVLAKDAEEEELERIIFGDSVGFREGLDNFSLAPSGAALDDDSEADEGDGDDYGNVADQDLFFFDTGPTAQPAGSLALAKAGDSEDDDDKPAWEDSDDERLVVSLASVPQLRKLRDTEDDDMVNGKEYVRRLRRQYERLYPVPDWAVHATGKAKRKRRHLEDNESDMESASDMDVDDDDLSTLPLARLLQNSDILSRTSKSSTKRRKLQAGTVEIARLKDVAGAGPVSTPSSLDFDPADILVIVCYNLAVVPPYVPAASVIWSQLDAIATPRKSFGSSQP
jgi:U3 small nucleolar RNA-associated protein 18